MMNIILSFDDGRIDTFSNAFNVIKENNLTASVHITTGFIDGSFITDEFGKNMKPISVDNIKEMFDYGIDISSHGDKHVMESTDFITSKAKINKWTNKNEGVGFSVPNSSATKADIRCFLDSTNPKPFYIRVGRNKKCRSFVNKVRYVLYKLFHTQFLFNGFNKNNLIKIFDPYNIESCVIKRHTKHKHIIRFIKKYSSFDCSLVLMLHSVVKKPSNEWEWGLDEFKLLCNELNRLQKNNLIKVTNLKTKVLDIGYE